MKAILVNTDRTLRWDEVPNPVIKEDEVLVKVAAAGVNRADLLQREGNYPPPPGCPDWMGLEIAGRIVAMGEEAKCSSSFAIGDAVCALLGGGGYAEYAAVRYDMLMPIPKGVTLTEAAAVPEAFATSYLNLFIEGGLRAGDTLLVTGGNSGLAGVMIPMAKAHGARVITTVRTEEKAAAIAHLGADRVVVTANEALPTALREELEAGHPVDLAIDCLGGPAVGACLAYLAHGARWIMIAALAGQMTEIDLKTVYVRNIRLVGSTLRSRAPAVKAEILARIVREVYPLIEAGSIRPTIHAILPIEEAEAAHELLYKSRSVGKVVLTVD